MIMKIDPKKFGAAKDDALQGLSNILDEYGEGFDAELHLESDIPMMSRLESRSVDMKKKGDKKLQDAVEGAFGSIDEEAEIELKKGNS